MCVSFMCMCISYEVVASSELTSVCWQYLLHRIAISRSALWSHRTQSFVGVSFGISR
jgi:hypothetical protein